MFKYFTKNNTYRYLDVINKLLIIYNNSVLSTIGMPPSKFNPSNIYSVWLMLNSLGAKIPHRRVKFNVGDVVRIAKEKVIFTKGYEETFSTEIFSVVKVILRMPQPVYELSDFYGQPIKGQFYNYELVKGTISPQTKFRIDKLVHTRNNNGIKQHLVKWIGYDATSNSWINATDIKKF